MTKVYIEARLYVKIGTVLHNINFTVFCNEVIGFGTSNHMRPLIPPFCVFHLCIYVSHKIISDFTHSKHFLCPQKFSS